MAIRVTAVPGGRGGPGAGARRAAAVAAPAGCDAGAAAGGATGGALAVWGAVIAGGAAVAGTPASAGFPAGDPGTRPAVRLSPSWVPVSTTAATVAASPSWAAVTPVRSARRGRVRADPGQNASAPSQTVSAGTSTGRTTKVSI